VARPKDGQGKREREREDILMYVDALAILFLQQTCQESQLNCECVRRERECEEKRGRERESVRV